MQVDKVTISIEAGLLRRIDRLVKEKIYPNRSRVFQDAVLEKMNRVDKNRLERELAKLDIDEEQQIADVGLALEATEWEPY